MGSKDNSKIDSELEKGMKKYRKDISIRANEKKYGHRSDDITEKILKIIRIYTVYGGISVKQLSSVVRFDRSTVQSYIKRLEAEEKIEKNKNKLYVSTDKLLLKFIEESISKSHSFGSLFLSFFNNMSVLYNFDGMVHSKRKKNVINNVFGEEGENYRLQFTKNDYLEKSLFEFSNRLGAFISFMIIYWYNPFNYNEKLPVDEYRIISHKAIQKTINYLMEPGVPHSIYDNFINMLNKSSHTEPRTETENDDQPVTPRQKFHFDVESALTNMYPKLMREFEKITDTLYDPEDKPLKLKMSPIGRKIKSDLIHFNTIDKQSKCKHIFNELKDYDYDRKMVECLNCGLVTTSSDANDLLNNQKRRKKQS